MKSYGFLIAPTLGWLCAQGIKFALTLRKDGFQFKDFYSSGGFPSSHTSAAVAVAAMIAFTEGISSSLFAIAGVFSAIVMYDAAGVRRSVGEHTLFLKHITKHDKKYDVERERLHIFLGHSPYEVLGGVVLGVAIGYVVAFFMS